MKDFVWYALSLIMWGILINVTFWLAGVSLAAVFASLSLGQWAILFVGWTAADMVYDLMLGEED